MIIVIMIISFLLDGIISNIVGMNSILLPLTLLTSFIIIYPYFCKDNKKYLIYLIIAGVFYDLAYGDIYLLNVIIFPIMGLFISFLYDNLSTNTFTFILKLLLVVSIYRLVTYIVYLVFSVSHFNILLLFTSIYRSLLLNIIYGLILYLITNIISNKFKISRNI